MHIVQQAVEVQTKVRTSLNIYVCMNVEDKIKIRITNDDDDGSLRSCSFLP